MRENTALSEAELQELAAAHGAWAISPEAMRVTYTFKHFRAAMAFVQWVALEAERLDHHPTWTNTWNRVSLSLTTHSAGNRVTALDAQLAAAVDHAAAATGGGLA